MLAFHLTFHLTSILAFNLAVRLTSFLAFDLTYVPAISCDIFSNILSDIFLEILCGQGPRVDIKSSNPPGWGPPDISWFINHYNLPEYYSYIYHVLELIWQLSYLGGPILSPDKCFCKSQFVFLPSIFFEPYRTRTHIGMPIFLPCSFTCLQRRHDNNLFTSIYVQALVACLCCLHVAKIILFWGLYLRDLIADN